VAMSDESRESLLLQLRNTDLEIGRTAIRRTEQIYETADNSARPYVFPDYSPYGNFYSSEIRPRRKIRWTVIHSLHRCRRAPKNFAKALLKRKKRLLEILEGGQLVRRSMRRVLHKWNSYGKN
jgi:hypothetical protein